MAIDRNIYVDPRVARQNARAAIKNDPVLALRELITNSDDSYWRLEDKGENSTGNISIIVYRKRGGDKIQVIDDAEGMNSQDMERNVGSYGKDTSGGETRGHYGRGLKEAIIGLGDGVAVSLKNNKLYACTLKDVRFKLPNEGGIKVTARDREDLGIKINGTSISIDIKFKKITVPLFDSFKYKLENHFALRDILSNSKRNVLLIEKDIQGKVKQKEKLSYNFPVGKKVYDEKLDIPKYPEAHAQLEVYLSDEDLLGPEEGYVRQNGLLFRAKRAIHDSTLFKYEHNDFAQRIFGHLTCDYLDKLLREDEGVLSDKRDRIDWGHPFCKQIRKATEQVLDKVIEKEKKEAEEEEKRIEDSRTKRRISNVMKKLNMIAKQELKDIAGVGTSDIGPALPSTGFDFIPDYCQIIYDKESTLILKALCPKVISSGSTVKIYSDNPKIKILTPIIKFHINNSNDGVITKNIKVIGKQIGMEGIVTAEVGKKKAEVLVKIVSERKPPKKTKKIRKVGFISDVIYDYHAEPRRRSKFEDGVIIIATRAPSVRLYLGRDGKNQNEPYCQVLVAELITEAFCREITKRLIESGAEPYLGDAAEAMIVVQNRKINQYAEIIHKAFVDQKYRRN